MIEGQGTVTKILGGGWYASDLIPEGQIRAKLSGRLRQRKIRVLPGDRVKIEVSEQDVTWGQITYRLS
jgi:translation initiation factor IF-1